MPNMNIMHQKKKKIMAQNLKYSPITLGRLSTRFSQNVKNDWHSKLGRRALFLVFVPHTSSIPCWKEDILLHTITESFFFKRICKKKYGLIFNEKIQKKMSNNTFFQIINFSELNLKKALCYCVVLEITFKMRYHLLYYAKESFLGRFSQFT